MPRLSCIAVLAVLRSGSAFEEPPCGCNGTKYTIDPHRASLSEKCAGLPSYTLSWSNGTWLNVSSTNKSSGARSWLPVQSKANTKRGIAPLGGDLIWQPAKHDSHLQPFDGAHFCEALPFNGDILFVGDSTSGEMAASLIWLLERNMSTCAKDVKVVRNDILDLARQRALPSPEGGRLGAAGGCQLVGRDAEWMVGETGPRQYACHPWAFPDRLAKTAVVVLNSGIHVQPCGVYLQQLEAAAKFVRQHARPEARLFFRNTVPGYAGCIEEMDARPQPFPTLEDAESFVWAHSFHDSKLVVGMNWVAESVFQKAGWGIIDAYSLSILRKERKGHVKANGVTDCLHFGEKGKNVIHHWNFLLYNALLH